MTERDEAQAALNAAVLYALRSGCFFPVRAPRPGWSADRLVKWGAMVNLHKAIARAGQIGVLKCGSETRSSR